MVFNILFSLVIIGLVLRNRVISRRNRQMITMLDNVPGLIWFKGMSGEFKFINRRFEEACKRSRREVFGKTDLDLWEDKTLAKSYRVDDDFVIESQQLIIREEEVHSKTSGPALHKTIKFPLYSGKERNKETIVGSGGIAFDLSEMRKKDDILFKQKKELERMKQLGEIGIRTSEIVHNLKNPLFIIEAYLSRFNKILKEEEVQQFEKQMKRIKEIIEDILTGESSIGNEWPRQYSLKELIDEEVVALHHLSESPSDVFTIDPSLALFKSSIQRNHMHQILSNVFMNSLEAVLKVEKPYIQVLARKAENPSFFEIVVSDNGSGISESELQSLFSPGFSTKKGGADRITGGNGLGLAYCKKMLENYGGAIKVVSLAPMGASVVMRLPLYCDDRVASAEDFEGLFKEAL